jgi:hypothetical protein
MFGYFIVQNCRVGRSPTRGLPPFISFVNWVVLIPWRENDISNLC